MATIGVNIISMVIFLWLLHNRLNGLPLAEWSFAFSGLLFACIVASLGSWGVSWLWENYLGNANFILLLGELLASSAIATIIFFVIAMQFKLPELEMLTSRIRQKLHK